MIAETKIHRLESDALAETAHRTREIAYVDDRVTAVETRQQSIEKTVWKAMGAFTVIVFVMNAVIVTAVVKLLTK